MSQYQRIPIDTSDEQDLITGLILSDDFCRRVLPMLRPEHLEDSGARRVLNWVLNYHTQYKKAPGSEIQSIFNTERKSLRDVEANSIEELLAALSNRYKDNGKNNWEYQADRARDYIRGRSLKVLSESINTLKDRGDLSKAEGLVNQFRTTSVQTSRWVQPFLDQELQQRALVRVDSGLFRMDGAIGKVFGWWQVGWLVAFFGSPKRGKSYILQEVAMQALVQGLRVAFISLEMGDEDMVLRFMQAATSLPKEKGKIKIPVWDCDKNQNDTCRLKERTNREPIPRDGGDLPSFREGSKYQPCVFCKTWKNFLVNYKVASWFKIIEKNNDMASKAIENTNAFALHYKGGNLQFRSFPRDTATLDDIDNALEELKTVHDFVPHIVVVDYADVIKKGDHSGQQDWQSLDEIWKGMSGMAGSRKILAISASQGNVKSFDAKTMKPGQVAGYTGKIAHVDLGITLNQIGDSDDGNSERDKMIMRLGTMVRRHGTTTNEQVIILQSLELGQPVADAWSVSSGYKLAKEE